MRPTQTPARANVLTFSAAELHDELATVYDNILATAEMAAEYNRIRRLLGPGTK
ncbi:hypothetical protein OG407_47805 [Streptomyces sp. NBC_01515]|uniref:hypothetical protein n=1 Tax=Streptomyces sp. NBC_01515 TaxID=2903890 RepID=UPI00386606F8